MEEFQVLHHACATFVVLMREICNDLIRQATAYIDPAGLFEMEPQEAVDKLMVTLKVCGTFKSVYFDYKSRANTEFRTRGAFRTRLSSHVSTRSSSVATISWISLKRWSSSRGSSALRLAATKGARSASVGQIYNDFTQVLETFTRSNTTCWTSRSNSSMTTSTSSAARSRSSSGVSDQSSTKASTTAPPCLFKLIESFEGLLEREFIQADLEPRLHRAAQSLWRSARRAGHVHTAKVALCRGYLGAGPPRTNMPPASASLLEQGACTIDVLVYGSFNRR